MSNQNQSNYFIKVQRSSSSETIKKNGSFSQSESGSSSSVSGLKNIVIAVDSAIKQLTEQDHFEVTKCNLPEGWGDKIITLVEKNPKATFVAFPKGVLSATEQNRLDKILKPRQVKAKKEQQKVKEKYQETVKLIEKEKSTFRMRYLMLGAIAGLALSFAFTPLSALTIVYSLVGIALGHVFGVCRGLYLGWSSEQYKNSDLKNVPEGEKNAIDAGIQATTWPNYFLSYTKPNTYAHPVSFACGMQKAMDEDTEFTKQFQSKLKI